MSDDKDGTRINHTQSGSTKPYLIRAIYQWAVDNGFTPQILVSTLFEDVLVPEQYVKDDQIILNIHPASVKNLELGNDFLMCSARFSGKPFELTVPVIAVMAIYARENGQGIVFQDGDSLPPPDDGKKKSKSQQKSQIKKTASDNSVSHLKLVK